MLTSRKLETASDMLKAIAHPARLSIIGLLEKEEKLSVTQIHEKLKLEQAVASQHLAILKSKGVLNCHREGKNCFYSLSQKQIAHILQCIDKCTK